MSKPETAGFDGWRVLAAGFVSTMLVVGSTAYAFGLFVLPVSKELGLSRSEAYRGLMLVLLSYAAWSPYAGRLFDRRPARPVIYAGAALLAVGAVIFAAAPNGWVAAFAIFVPLGMGASAAGALPANTLATRWFVRRRGRVLGIVAIATSAGGVVVVRPLASLIEAVGWRAAAAILGIGISIIIVLCTRLFVVDRPADLGQEPDGGGATTAQSPHPIGTTESRLYTLPELMRTPNFWLVGLGMGLLLGSDQALLGSMIPYAEGRGIAKPDAALIITVQSSSAIVGKFLVGWLADRFDKRLLFLPVVAANVGFLLFLLSEPSYSALLIVSAVLGIAVGGVVPIWSTLVAECFGQRSFGTAFGSMNLLTTPTAILSIVVAGAVFDRMGNYNRAFEIFIGLDLTAVLLVLAVRRPRQPVVSGSADD